MSIVVIPSKPRASRPRRIADSHDARSAGNRSSWRSYSSLQFANDVYGKARTPRDKATKVTVVQAPTGTYKPRLRRGI